MIPLIFCRNMMELKGWSLIMKTVKDNILIDKQITYCVLDSIFNTNKTA
jgi:hypothetical protein